MCSTFVEAIAHKPPPPPPSSSSSPKLYSKPFKSVHSSYQQHQLQHQQRYEYSIKNEKTWRIIPQRYKTRRSNTASILFALFSSNTLLSHRYLYFICFFFIHCANSYNLPYKVSSPLLRNSIFVPTILNNCHHHLSYHNNGARRNFKQETTENTSNNFISSRKYHFPSFSSKNDNYNEKSSTNCNIPQHVDDDPSSKHLDSTSQKKSEEWVAGDIETDFKNLFQAVEIARGPERLEASKRKSILNAFARGKRLLIPDFWKFIVLPIVLGIGMSPFLSIMGNVNGFIGSSRLMMMIVCSLMDLHYWWFVLFSNIIIMFPIIIQQSKHVSTKINNLKNGYRRQPQMTWMDQKKEIFDPPRFLWELWTSCTLGTMIFSLFSLIHPSTRTSLLFPLHNQNNRIFLTCIHAFIQLMTRLTTVLSFHQYPKILYELKREDQPRPFCKSVALMKSLVDQMTRALPLGFVCDLAKVMCTVFTMTRRNGAHIMGKICNHSTQTLSSWWYFGIILSLIGPMCHLFAFTRLFQIQFTTNLSLAQSYENTFQLLKNKQIRSYLTKWRWSLRWRQPERLSKTCFKWYQLFMAGYASHEDRSRKSLLSSFADDPWKASYDNEDMEGGRTSLYGNDSLKEDLSFKSELLRLEAERFDSANENSWKEFKRDRDRSTWVPNAMNQMAEQHEQNYQDKNFQDYLGVALHQTLGIGFSFDYDHESTLSSPNPNASNLSTSNETPSIHRLRARAAKSAIAYTRQLYDPIKAQERLNSISDTNVKNKESERMQQYNSMKEEMCRNVLTELLPSNAPAPEEFFTDNDASLSMQIWTESQSQIGSSNWNSMADSESYTMEIGESPVESWMKDDLRREFGDDYVNDPWVQRGIDKEEISKDDLKKMKQKARKDAALLKTDQSTDVENSKSEDLVGGTDNDDNDEDTDFPSMWSMYNSYDGSELSDNDLGDNEIEKRYLD